MHVSLPARGNRAGPDEISHVVDVPNMLVSAFLLVDIFTAS